MPDWTAYVRERLRLHGIRPQREQDVIDDLAAQLDDAYREALARGLSDAAALAAAAAHISDWQGLAQQVERSRRLANSTIDRVEDRLSDAAGNGRRGAGLAAGILQDVRFALRLARKAPGFTAVAVLTLALGIGANTTIFSWINAILLNPIPGADARRLFDVDRVEKNGSSTSMSYPDFMDLRAATTGTLDLFVHDASPASLAGPEGTERIWVELVSDNFFDVLQVTPAAGRGFQAEEGRAPIPVVVVGEELARRRFGGTQEALGQTAVINSTAFTIVGVAPMTFSGAYTGLNLNVWLPIQMSNKILPGANRVAVRSQHWLDGLARPHPGVSASRASSELTSIANRISKAEGGTGDSRMDLTPLWRSPHGAQSVLGPVLLVLMAMVAIVLLIACGNLANLLLSRASARRREFAVRLSLGCGRRRLIRQLLTEALLLVSVGAVFAIVAQLWTGNLLASFVPPTDLPIGLAPRLEPRVVLFALSAALASALIFGLAPALQAGRTDLVTHLKNDSAQAMGGRRSWFRSGLVVAQVALSLLLLASAGLFLRSLQNARLFDPGFKTDRVLLSSIDLFAAGFDRDRGRQTLTRMLDDLRALPGVQSVSLSRRVPLGLSTPTSSTDLEPQGYTSPKDDPSWAYLAWVGPDYFQTMSIPVITGREFAVTDRADQAEVLVVNRTFADRYWPRQNAIGRRVRIGKDWFAVAGVVADSKYRRLNEPPAPFVYLSTVWNYRPDVTLHVRTAGDPRLLTEPVRSAIRRAAPELPVFGVMTLEDHVKSASFQQRLVASLLAAFGALALLLSAIGLYATMAYSVSRRTRELGARIVLGATRGDILRLVLMHGARLAAIGVVIGLLLAMAAAPLFASLLVGVRPIDLPTFAAVTIVLSAIAGIASYMPARRAARLDPLQALRYD